MSYNIIFKPSRIHLQQLESWLKVEEEETKDGFYCNWNIILKSFNLNDLVVLVCDDQVIGFLVFAIRGLTAEINIAEIKPDFRKLGLGRLFVDQFLIEISKLGVLVVELYCSPISSEPIWRKLNFTNFPTFPYDSKIRMYRQLVPALKPGPFLDKNIEVIELWDDEPFIAINQTPMWKWEIKYKTDSRKLIQPIIHPAFYEWQICWRIGKKVLLKDKIKYFNLANIEAGNFIIITELPKQFR